MSVTWRSLFILILNLTVAGVAGIYAQADSTGGDEEDSAAPPKRFEDVHQLMLGIDLFDPILASVAGNWHAYELEASYYYKKDYYLAAEGGWGGSMINYDNLKYTTTDYFARAGFNRSILLRENSADWDMMFLGLRAAMARVNRGNADYMITDSLWGNVSGQSASKSFGVVWAEITCGMRVELVRGIMAGWNIRGKFLMNGKSFRDLAPLNISGFGKGDKSANFGFNLYLDYAIRWEKRRLNPSKE